MKYLCENLASADSVLMIDTDVYCSGSLDACFEEISERVLLYDVQHALDHPHRKSILHNYRILYDNAKPPVTHYGGEFIGATAATLGMVLRACDEVIRRANECARELTDLNDEHITSIAVHRTLRSEVGPANAYIYRYWTRRFYLVSTNYYANPVALWHLPNEKGTGLNFLYKYIVRNDELPSNAAAARIFGLPPRHQRYSLLRIYLYMRSLVSTRLVNRAISLLPRSVLLHSTYLRIKPRNVAEPTVD